MSRVYKVQPFVRTLPRVLGMSRKLAKRFYPFFYSRMKMLHYQLHDSNVHTFQCVFAIHQRKGISFVHQGSMGFNIY
jgi:hypothetical protein